VGSVHGSGGGGGGGGDDDDDHDDDERVVPGGLYSRRKIHEEYHVTVRNDMARRAGSNAGYVSRSLLAMLASRIGAELPAGDVFHEDGENCEIM
jgi:nuclear receptor interaction protein